MQPTFERTIAENAGRIRFIASRYANKDDIEDMYQEILLQLWRSFDSFKGDASVSTWIYKVAFNTAMTYVRKTVKQRELNESVAALFKTDAQPASEHCQSELLKQFVHTLGDTDATILMMYLDGLPAADMAEVIGISANGVSARVKRIKTTFEQQYIGEA